MTHSTLQQIAQQEKTRREILHRGDLIPPLPDLVVRLLGLLNKQETEPQDLERLMQNDQVLVAKMLAMVNSPFYGLNRQIRTIKDAVMVLGFRGVRSLVLATSTAQFLQRDFGCYGHPPKGLWLHAVAVAAASRWLARSCRMSPDEAEMLFVGGLLHDIGKLLLVGYFSGSADAGLHSNVSEYERSKIGIDHAEAGALIAAKWNLAPEIQDVIGSHHDVPTETNLKAVAVVRLAESVAHEVGTGYEPGKAPAMAALPGDLATLALTADAWTTLRAELVVAMEEAVTALGKISP